MNTAMRSILLAVTGLVSWHLAAAEQPSTRKVALNINAPSLARALIQFTEQTGLQMVFSAQGQVKDLPARPLTGTYTPQAALDRLLENSGLRYEYIDSKTVAIRAIEAGPKETAAVDQDPAGQMRLAAARVEEKDSTEVRAGETTMVNVKGKRDRTFAVNADIPRTINDAQPYYIFDRETIERSGAVNVDDFLKQRLTMNATVVTNSEQSSIGDYKGTTSNINLRGLGTDKTLVLVNGRRRPGVTSYSGSVEENQGDLAGIPVGSIDRIEVLPASASGIYGGSAIGGVVNVILREDYAGGEARVGYDNSFDSDNPRRSASLDYGFTLEGGRTHLNFSAAWSDQTPMYLNDRVDIFDRYVARILANSPNFFTVSPIPGLLGDLPYLGSLPNIVPSSSAGLLTLHGPDRTSAADNIPLNSRNTFVPAGTSSATSLAELRAGLLANAGRINMENPSTSQYPNGLQRPFHQPTESRSLRFSARRNLTPTWELYADLMYSENNIRSVYAVGNTLSVSAARPINPFTTSVIVSIPDALRMPYINESTNRSVTVGTIVHLPREWMTAFDYTYSDNKSYHFSNSARDNAAINGDLQSGALNPFVDLLRYPLDLAKYYAPSTFNGGMRLHDFALRGSGPLPALPWGQPRVTLGLEHRIRSVLEGRESEIYPITTTNNLNITTFAKDSMVNAAYMEAQVPLVRDSVLPLVHSLDLQLAGRVERYTQDTGTTSRYRYPNRIPPVEFFQGPTTPNGEPFSSQTSYSSNNYTLGLKYQPVESIILRAAHATAFVPPMPDYLTPTPVDPNAEPITVTDPTRPPAEQVTGNVQQITGGNPDLRPQNSEGFNAGIIWMPRWKPLAGLRFNAEYYRIDQFDAIDFPQAQFIVDNEARYPGRVVRDSNGVITQVNSSAINIFSRKTDGLDLSLDYPFSTAYGEFNLHVVHTTILKLLTQYSATEPAYDGLDFPNDGGAARYKSNLALDWTRRNWSLVWSARYFSSYKQVGAPGSPLLLTIPFLNPRPASIPVAQGGNTIPSQLYQNVVIGYDFGSSPRAGALSWVSGVHVQFLVKNVFEEVPPLDVWRGDYGYYMSGYGDPKGRSFSLSLRKAFGRK